MEVVMRYTTLLVAAALSLTACGGATSPYGGGGGGGSGGGGGGGGGPVGQIIVGNILFKSSHNGTQNPAIDTVAAGSSVTWTWTATGSISHSVQSQGSSSFVSSAIQAGNEKTYSVTFNTPGTYSYDCAVHGAAMSGTIVVR
jgi:plastocyanin